MTRAGEENNNKGGAGQEGLITSPLHSCGSSKQSDLLRGAGTVPSGKDTLPNAKLVFVTCLNYFLGSARK